MGFLDGFLGGVVQQRNTIAQQNREDSQASQAREDAILQHLLTSDDPEIKAHAVAGMLESANPKRKKGGFAGWLGQNEANPQMDKIRDLVAQDQQFGHHVPSDVAAQAGQHTAAGNPSMGVAITTAAAAGSSAGDPKTGSPAVVPGAADKPPTLITRAAPAAGGPSGSLEQPGGKSLTEVGSAPPPPTETAPSPDQPAPPVRPEMFSAASPSAVLGQASPPAVGASPAPAAAPEATPGAPPPTPAAAGASPSAVLGQKAPPPIGAGPLSPRGDVFRTPETQARKTKVATSQGDVEGEMAGLVSAGFSEQEARQVIKDKMSRGTRAGALSGLKSTSGEVTDPDTGKVTQVFGAFDPATGSYHGTDPDSDYYGIAIPGFRPKTAGGAAQHAGTAVNDAHQRLYGKPFNQGDQASQQAAQLEVEKGVGRVSTARAGAANDAKLDAPIGVTNALRYPGVPANTTLRQLMDRVPLSQQDQDKVHAIGTLEGSFKTIEGLLPKVFPDVGSGIVGRVTTAISLFSQSAGRQPDITALNSAIASTMAGIVRANGVSQRLNQKELDLAQEQMVNTTTLHGDTLESAQVKMEILRDLISRVKENAPTGLPGGGAIGAPPPVGAAPAPGTGTPPPAAAAPASGKVASKLDAPVPGWFVDAHGNLVQK